MYDDHFGFHDRPFQLTPDPRFWFDTATHRKAMAYLGYGLTQGEGFIVITGDIGAGKTTLVGHLMAEIDAERMNAIKIVSTAIEADDLLRVVATGLGIAPAGLSKAELLTTIERGLHTVARGGRRTLLIVDEAQALPVSALEELRMLSNFQAGGHAMLQIFLLGQPEFRERLHGSDRLEQLRQRVIAVHHLSPMEEDEVAPYVAHRLSVAGWTGRPDFSEDAFPVLFRASGGVPRRLNQLMGRVLLHAALTDAVLVDAALVEEVVSDAASDMAMPAAASVPATEPRPVPEPRAAPPAPAAPRADPIVPPFRPAVVGRSIPLRAAPEPIAPPTPVAPATAPSEEMAARMAALEARIDEQDGALRRILTLLVDWVENDRSRSADDRATMRAGVRDAA